MSTLGILPAAPTRLLDAAADLNGAILEQVRGFDCAFFRRHTSEVPTNKLKELAGVEISNALFEDMNIICRWASENHDATRSVFSWSCGKSVMSPGALDAIMDVSQFWDRDAYACAFKQYGPGRFKLCAVASFSGKFGYVFMHYLLSGTRGAGSALLDYVIRRLRQQGAYRDLYLVPLHSVVARDSAACAFDALSRLKIPDAFNVVKFYESRGFIQSKGDVMVLRLQDNDPFDDRGDGKPRNLDASAFAHAFLKMYRLASLETQDDTSATLTFVSPFDKPPVGMAISHITDRDPEKMEGRVNSLRVGTDEVLEHPPVYVSSDSESAWKVVHILASQLSRATHLPSETFALHHAAAFILEDLHEFSAVSELLSISTAEEYDAVQRNNIMPDRIVHLRTFAD